MSAGCLANHRAVCSSFFFASCQHRQHRCHALDETEGRASCRAVCFRSAVARQEPRPPVLTIIRDCSPPCLSLSVFCYPTTLFQRLLSLGNSSSGFPFLSNTPPPILIYLRLTSIPHYPLLNIVTQFKFWTSVGNMKKFTFKNWNRRVVRPVILGSALACSAVNTARADLVYNFTNQTWTGFNFNQAFAPGSFYGTLTSVSSNATLNASTNETYADDLAIYVAGSPLALGGLLQVGGFSNLSANQRYSWANGGSSTPGTPVFGIVNLDAPITFNSGTNANQAIWIGNGFGSAGTSGTWTGNLTLHGLTAGAAPTAVPEPSSLAILGVGAVGLFLRKRLARGRKTNASNGVEGDPTVS